ncbi:high-temperature-induced dauer-formation protein-domain-containing protein [Rhizoctonia solani]|nr:high-temperature-induced dauer-formation protein-domain-containing protein [Rhizoctonia solani]
MFNLGKRLSTPFGLLGEDAKLSFRTKKSGIARLYESRNIPDSDDEYWSQYYLLFDSPSDVSNLIVPHDIRRALSDAPENLSTLLIILIKRLQFLMTDHTFPTEAPVIPTFSSLYPGTAQRNPNKEALNCVRVLARILPVVFEGDADHGRVEELFWKRMPKEQSTQKNETDQSKQFVIDDEEDEDDPKSPTPQATPQQVDTEPSWGESLLNLVIDLLFCCGFTIPKKVQVDHHKINYMIWVKGIGSASDIGTARDLESNKAEVLRLLLVLLSKQIYIPPTVTLSMITPALSVLAQRTPRRRVLTLLCSLLNTSLHPPNLSPLPLSSMPYNHLVTRAMDADAVPELSISVLCVLLDYQSGDARDRVAGGGEVTEDSEWTPTSKSNAFRYSVAKLHRASDFEFIFYGILAILEQNMVASHGLLPGSRKGISYLVELYVLLWKMLDLNRKFRAFVMDSDKCVDLIAYLLCTCLEIKDKPQNQGFCRALSYIIQSMSSDFALGSKLHLPVKITVPTKWATPGTTGDFMITSIYSIVATTSGQLTSLYPALIITLSNVSPHLTQLTITASARLISLLTAFSSPLFLLADESHPRLVYFILEVFNNVITHHLQGNPNLIYALLRARNVIEGLSVFTLRGGVREVRRREEAAKGLDTKGKGKVVPGTDNADPSREKRDLIEREKAQLVPTPEELESGLAGGDDELAAPIGMSEKARGKMREDAGMGRAESIDLSAEEELAAAVALGKNGFVPTQEWVSSWQRGLPLDIVQIAIAELSPKILELQASGNRASSTAAILDMLRSAQLSHVLPAPGPLSPRKFHWSDASLVWLNSLLWGEIYVRGTTPLGIWNGTNVRLFGVKHTPQPRRVTDTVQTVMGGFWGGASGAGGANSQAGTATPPASGVS